MTKMTCKNVSASGIRNARQRDAIARHRAAAQRHSETSARHEAFRAGLAVSNDPCSLHGELPEHVCPDCIAMIEADEQF